MAKIEALTPEQEILRQEWHRRWFAIGCSTEAADRPRAEAAITAMYAEIGEPEPRYLWVQSPATGYLAIWALAKITEDENALGASLGASLRDSLGDSLWASLRASLGASLWDSLGDSLRASLWASLRASLRASLGDSLGDSLRDSLGDSLGASLRDSLGDSLWASLGDSLWDSLGDSLRASLGDSLWDSLRDSLGDSLWASLGDSLWDNFRGQQDAYWTALYGFCREIGVQFDERRSRQLDLWSEIAQSCGWWWPFRGLCIACDRPEVVRWETDRTPPRLHCDNGPSLRFRDGWEIYSWHGLRVPERLILHPETITATEIHAEKNQELRRAMMERMGWSRYLAESGARKIASDDTGELLEVDGLGDGDAVARFVHVRCPSTSREYTLRVPPQTETARAGVAWTFGVDPEKYLPSQET